MGSGRRGRFCNNLHISTDDQATLKMIVGICIICVSSYVIQRYDGLETKQKSMYDVFVCVYVNLCTVKVIELIVFWYNEVTVQ